MIAQKINTIVFLLFLLAGAILFFNSKKDETSSEERRKLSELPLISENNIWDGTYMRQIDNYVNDHFVFRKHFVQTANKIDEYKGINLQAKERIVYVNVKKNVILEEVNDSQEIVELDEEPTSSGLLIVEGSIYQIFGGNSHSAAAYSKIINNYRIDLPSDVRVFNCVVPSAGSFIHNDRYQHLQKREYENIQLIKNGLSQGIIYVPAASLMLEHEYEYLFFNSDHHWTGRAAYYAYKAFCNSAGIVALEMNQMERRVKNNFLGSLYYKCLDETVKDNPDSVEYFIPPVKTTTIAYRKENQAEFYNWNMFAHYASGGNSYGVFLGGDKPLMKIVTSNKNGKKVVLIKNSYGNPFATFLVNHYEEVYIVDFRYYNLKVLNLIKEKSINDVIILNGVFSANSRGTQGLMNYIKGSNVSFEQVASDTIELKFEHELDTILNLNDTLK
tara:strand:- start:1595 stop:2926 length:1332 start_codon:yes stop_codon:yes gene_type:complete